MGKQGCSVYDCKPSKSDGRHCFPDPEKDVSLFKKWMAAINNKLLRNLSMQYIYQHYRVCTKHFKKEDVSVNNRLKKGAFPKLALPEKKNKTIEQSIPEGAFMMLDSSYIKLSDRKPIMEQHIEKGPYSEADAFLISPFQQVLRNNNSLESEDVGSEERDLRTPPLQTGLLNQLKIRNSKDLTPKAKYLYTQAVLYKRKHKTQLIRTSYFRAELSKALKYSKTRAFNKLTASFNGAARNFFRSQIECCNKKPNGRRFTTEDKILALALYKQMGSGYKFLSRIFALPSRCTLMKLLNKIPIVAGLNKVVFNALREMSRNLRPADRYCSLIFDEMSLMPHLHYNVIKDEVEGFEDFGDYKTTNIADHVQVFMLSLLIIYNYFKGVNNILSGKDQRHLPNNCSLLYKQASEIFKKRQKLKK